MRPHLRPTWRKVALLTVAMAFLAVGCADKGSSLPQDALDPQGSVAKQINNLAMPVFVVAGIVFVLVETLLVVAALKFRRRSDDEAPVQVHGNARLELTWTVLPALTLAVIGIFTVGTIIDINKIPKGPDVLEVTVVGHQWWWEFDYPGKHIKTANELHIPIDTQVAVTLKSADVIHSFWPPKLAGKIDVVPGRINHMVVNADKAATYYGQCAEFCGQSHANMRLRVVAQTKADWDKWVADNAAPPAEPSASDPDAVAGKALFRSKGCASCHTINGYSAGNVGPNLTHLQQRTVFAGAIFDLNDKNLRSWLRNPPAEKPGSIMPNLNLTEDEITQLIAYLDTLK
ncbi:MAG TPA: cytochrome c oxidase subunit II [Acidimicrobiales bacterium]|nr:cytochrome c oxidase subunit II [Acidimicrobiales bacterium]